MLKNFIKKFLSVTLPCFVCFACAAPLSKESQKKSIQSYLEIHREYRAKFCRPQTEEDYKKLLTKYRGSGLHIPDVGDEVDYVTLEKILPELEQKIQWIQQESLELSKRKKIPTVEELTLPIEKIISELLKAKKITVLSTDEKEKKKAFQVSHDEMAKLRKEFRHLIDQISFLTNYHYPNDHLKNRKIYDDFKDLEDPTSKQIANYSLMHRRIVEDGAYNPDHTDGDQFLRTTIETVALEMTRPMLLIEEDLRYDLQWILKRMGKELNRTRPELLARLKEWEERTSRLYQFYKELILPENRQKSRELIKEHNQAQLQLKEFVFSRQSDSFEFWKKQSEVNKALFTLDTILYNEVGDVDKDEPLERLDVAQVVFNRQGVDEYHTLKKDQPLYKRLLEKFSEKDIQSEAWLNILFRQGEFSFTYYYIPGVVKMFCSDLSPLGRRLQHENLEIALSVLREPRMDFTPLRYFSRASMLGRINMASVWDNYQKFPERAGLLMNNQGELKKSYQKGEFTFLYEFIDPKGEGYIVLEINNKICVAKLTPGGPIFYSYRNPHYFAYFTLR